VACGGGARVVDGDDVRVLKPGGQLLVSTWDRRDRNIVAHIAGTAIEEYFEKDPPTFYRVPFSMYDPAELEQLASEAGFANVKVDSVELEGESPSVAEAAEVYGVSEPMMRFRLNVTGAAVRVKLAQRYQG